MDTMIKEINSSLKEIVDNLAEVKDASASVLAEVELKIGEKMDEAKLFKNDVDDNKRKIKGLDDEIADLEHDLADLNERFGKKDLNAIVETGNREINNKINEKQGHIAKHRAKIGELTEKGRSIKELLNSLKKDKKVKEDRVDMLTKIFNYYNEQLSRIIEHSETNPDQLDAYLPTIKVYKESENDDSLEGVFDDIISITDTNEETDLIEVEEETINLDLEIDEKVVEEEAVLDDIYEQVKDAPEIDLDETPAPEGPDVEAFLNENNLNVDSFKNLDSIKGEFDPENAKKVIDVLKDNDIDVENVYHAPAVLIHPNPDELGKVINKLLAEQPATNVGYIIGRLNNVKAKDITDAIKALGPDIKSVNINEIVLKADNTAITPDLSYITELGFNNNDVTTMTNNLPAPVVEAMSAFPELVRVNFNSLNKFGAKNTKEVFINYGHVFLQDPNRFDAILDKYDPADLVRCVEKNAAVIEKL